MRRGAAARGAAEEPAGSGGAQTRLGVSACGRSAWRPRRSDAGCAVVTVSAFLSGVRCPVSPWGLSSDRCPVRASERPGVQCPASGVRVSDGNEVVGRGGGANSRTAGMAGVGVVARRVHDGVSSARGWSLALEAGTGYQPLRALGLLALPSPLLVLVWQPGRPASVVVSPTTTQQLPATTATARPSPLYQPMLNNVVTESFLW